MTRATPPEDYSDLERELAALEPPALTAAQRARLLSIPEQTAQPRLWLPSRRLKRTALVVWAAAASIGLFFGNSGVFDVDDARTDQASLDADANADAELDLLAELSLPNEMEDEP